VKNMSKAAFGRLEAYTSAFSDDGPLSEALKRNVYRGAEVPAEAISALIKYVREYQP